MSKLAFVHEWEALLEASRELILMLRSEEDGEKPTPTLTCLGDFLIVDGSGFAYDHLKSAEAFLVHCIVWTAKCLLGFENVRRDSTTEFCYEIGINQPFLSKKTQYGTSAIGSWINIHTPTTVHITKEAHVPEPVLENIEDCEIMLAGVCNYYDRLMAKMVEHYPDDQHPIYWELYPELRKQKTGQLPTSIELTHSGLVVNFKAPEDLDKEIHIGRGHSEPFHVLGDGIVISGVFPDDPNEAGKIVDIEQGDEQK